MQYSTDKKFKKERKECECIKEKHKGNRKEAEKGKDLLGKDAFL